MAASYCPSVRHINYVFSPMTEKSGHFPLGVMDTLRTNNSKNGVKYIMGAIKVRVRVEFSYKFSTYSDMGLHLKNISMSC